VNPGFVETPGRKKYTRKSIIPGDMDNATSPVESEPFPKADLLDMKSVDSVEINGRANGDANGHANGNANGGANGHINGNANGGANGHANGHANGSVANKAITRGRKESVSLALNWGPYDTSGEREFGGSFGMTAMMIGFPALMYYMWIGSYFYDGKFPTPTHGQTYAGFFGHMWNLVKTEAYPNARAWKIYWYFGLTQMCFYMLLPGVWRKGKPLPHAGMKMLDYYCSGMWSFYTSIALGLILHFTGTFKLYTLIEEFGHIMSVAIISGFLCSTIAYVSAILRGQTIRMTGYPIYDFFLGAEVNPRLFGILDFKMFLEVRIPWYTLFFLSLGTCLKQYEQYGFVSFEALFLLAAHWLYANACAKGEHLIITTWYVSTTIHLITKHVLM
jgi:delta24(24(1))-sterol reductase